MPSVRTDSQPISVEHRTASAIAAGTATHQGQPQADPRPVVEIQEFLSARSGASIPDTVARLLEDVADRSAKVHDRGLARLIECADPALAALIANDSRTRKHCMRAGERHLVVPASSEAAFKRTLREVGYLLAMGETRLSKNRRVTPPDDSAPQAAEV